MKKLAIIFSCFFCAINMQAQDITGEHYLSGVMETASGFKLNADSSFQFFFSYGALDRFGKGKWSLQNDSAIVFNSDKRPPLDFFLKDHSTTGQKNITIRIDDDNKNILQYVQGYVKTRSGKKDFEMNSDGIALVEDQPIDSIALILTLCPDRYSVFPVGENDNNFVFRFEPWIIEVFFENFVLKYSDSKLIGKHPLLQPKDYIFEKQ